MNSVERTNYGYKVTLAGFVIAAEMHSWLENIHQLLKEHGDEPFGVIIDIRKLRILSSEARQAMIAGKEVFDLKNLKRVALVVDGLVTTLRYRQIAREIGDYCCERFLDASRTKNWEQVALAWVQDGIDPDRVPQNNTFPKYVHAQKRA